MAVSTSENPAGLDAALDLPQGPVQRHVPRWSENYLWNGYNPDTGIFYYLHLGRWPGHPTWWEGVVHIALPDGDVLVAKTFGEDETLSGLGAGALRADCVEPHKQWRLRYRGMCHRMTRDQNSSRVLRVDLPVEPVEFDLSWQGIAPVWSVSHQQGWSDGRHYEQHGQFRGWLDHAGGALDLEGFGCRDHSIGPRDMQTFRGHTWFAAHFPESERSTTVLVMRDQENLLQKAMLVNAGELQEVTVTTWPAWEPGPHFTLESFDIVIEQPDPQKIHCVRTPQRFWWTAASPAGMHPGMDPADAQRAHGLVVLENSLICTSNGESGYGFVEISRRH